MKIKNVSIKNFKTFDSAGIDISLDNLTALVGENSVGKSNVIEALDLFFNYSKAKLKKTLFHHNGAGTPIKILVTFFGLTDEEKRTFKVHLAADDTLTITQVISAEIKDPRKTIEEAENDDLEFSESKHGIKRIPTEEFEWTTLEDKPPTKKDIKTWWKNDLFVGEFDFKSLFPEPATEPEPTAFQDKLELLWENHGPSIPTREITGDDAVLGWKNKLKGNLPKFFYIPAAKNLSDDLKVTKTSSLGEILSFLSAGVSGEVKDEFRAKSRRLIEEMLAKIDTDEEGNSKVAKINRALNENLGIDLGCNLKIELGQPQIEDVVFPSPTLFANDGYYSDLSHKGHGVQRLAIFSLLRTFHTYDLSSGTEKTSFILGIEEPEIYLHPPVKRSVYRLLRELSDSKGQVLYSTHDNHFLSVENFDQIRLFRKEGELPRTYIHEFKYDDLREFYQRKFGLTVDVSSLRDRFNHIVDQSKNEGFFAKKIIICEGETEVYALPNYFSRLDFDLDQHRISLISAGSVDSISYLLTVFNEFHIPCFVIFDGDKPEVDLSTLTGDNRNTAKNRSKRNKELLVMLGETIPPDEEWVFPSEKISEKYAVWTTNFEKAFHLNLPNYTELKSEAKGLYGSDSKPLTAKYISEKSELTDDPSGNKFKLLALIDKIKNLNWNASVLT